MADIRIYLQLERQFVQKALTIWACLIIACAPNLEGTYGLFWIDVIAVGQRPEAFGYVYWEIAMVAV